jgi:predicted TIM-barrel fold metal-dependent hydrolase
MKKQFLLLFLAVSSSAQQPPPAKETISLEEYSPKSSLITPENPRSRAKYPFVDIHNHQRFPMEPDRLKRLLEDMDSINLQLMVNLSGGYGDRLKNAVDFASTAAPGRFVVFANLDFRDIDEAGYGQRAASQLEQDIRRGAKGLKLFKSFGMDLKDSKGQRIPVNDPRFAPVWALCAKFKIPVLIHTADPKQFWEPVDKHNERWLELNEIPGRRRPPDKNVPWEQLIAEQHDLFRKNRQTVFINAHLGWLGGDLARLGRLLDECPNVYTEIGAVLAELGRQPRTARAWFSRYQDRVLFGKDSWNAAEYHTYFRVLETADEYFDYYRKRHAFWKMYGLDLPDEVLRKLYYANACRLLGLDESVVAGRTR